MMKLYVIIAAIIFFAACNSGAGKTGASDSADAMQDIVNTGGTSIDSAENISGKNLIAANDCLTCHKIDEKSIGPSYKQVAEKYEMNEGNIENLAHKIIKGGKGLWGQNAMTPHPTLSQPQAQEMARYILSLRNPSDATK